MMLVRIKMDSLEWYGYRLLKLIISHAESGDTYAAQNNYKESSLECGSPAYGRAQ
jgi:hypothetical protein